MPNTVLLNNVDHQALRVLTQRSAALGDGVMTAVTFPAEFRSLQAHYPIVFRKSSDGTTLEPVALLGFEEGQNLFLSAQGWDASYLPLAIERLPFYIGRDGDGLVVHIDLDSPRVSQDTGEAVFLPQGGSTEFLERVNSMLLAIHQGLQGTPALVAALMEHNLLEAFVLEVQQTNGTRFQLSDFYTVHEERLQALSGDALQRLSQAGHLQAAYMALASLSQIRALVERHHRLGDTQA
jgi:hypothetical protein